MTPDIYATYAIPLNKYRWPLLIAIFISAIFIAALIFLNQAILGLVLAGPLILVPWVAFLLCCWFQSEVKHDTFILWCQAIMLDVLFIVALLWPFMVASSYGDRAL